MMFFLLSMYYYFLFYTDQRPKTLYLHDTTYLWTILKKISTFKQNKISDTTNLYLWQSVTLLIKSDHNFNHYIYAFHCYEENNEN